MVTTFWMVFGFAGQFFFFMRFLWQWIASEKHGKSIIPEAFWYFSIIGSLMLLTYAIQRRDPVFIVGQSTGTFIYLRNLILIHREKRAGRPQGKVSAVSELPEEPGAPGDQSK